MASLPTVGIGDDLSSRHPAVPHGPTHNEPSGRVDEILCLTVDKLLLDRLLDDFLYDAFPDHVVGDIRGVPGRHNDGVDFK